MKKTATLAALSVAIVLLVSVAHYFDREHWGLGWVRMLLAVPIVYAGLNFRRSGAIAVSLIICVLQGPLVIIKYSKYGNFSPDHVTAVIFIAIFSVMFAHILRKERENNDSLEYIHELIRATRGSIDESKLFATLESAFAERCQTKETAIHVFGPDGALRPWRDPGAAPLSEGHLFYKVAETRHFIVSASPAHDSRMVWTGPEGGLASISHLAAFPLGYAGNVKGVISVLNSPPERFDKETITFLEAVKQTVENTLLLGEKLRSRVHHEMRKIKIRDTFTSYLSRSVAEEILKTPDNIDPGGELRNVSIMFTEVTNFSLLMKTSPPEQLLSDLNEFFSAAIDTVFEHDGALDKFIGDNVMAFWGAPLADPDSEMKAVSCAVKLQQKLALLNEKWQCEGRSPFNVCIGINSGPAVAGNIGSVRRMEYTVIGDNVNLAARIKSLSSKDNIPILVSASTFAKTKDAFRYSTPLEAAVKGKSASITVYRLLIDDSKHINNG